MLHFLNCVGVFFTSCRYFCTSATSRSSVHAACSWHVERCMLCTLVTISNTGYERTTCLQASNPEKLQGKTRNTEKSKKKQHKTNIYYKYLVSNSIDHTRNKTKEILATKNNQRGRRDISYESHSTGRTFFGTIYLEIVWDHFCSGAAAGDNQRSIVKPAQPASQEIHTR